MHNCVASTQAIFLRSDADGSVHQCPQTFPLSCPKGCAGLQAADVKMGAINIRSEEGVTPESVLAGFSRAEQEEVRSLLLTIPACQSGFHSDVCSP